MYFIHVLFSQLRIEYSIEQYHFKCICCTLVRLFAHLHVIFPLIHVIAPPHVYLPLHMFNCLSTYLFAHIHFYLPLHVSLSSTCNRSSTHLITFQIFAPLHVFTPPHVYLVGCPPHVYFPLHFYLPSSRLFVPPTCLLTSPHMHYTPTCLFALHVFNCPSTSFYLVTCYVYRG